VVEPSQSDELSESSSKDSDTIKCIGGELALFNGEQKQQKKPRGVKMSRKNKLSD